MRLTDRPCEVCGGPLYVDDGWGRRLRRYCSDACRQKAYRLRGGRASGTSGAERRRHLLELAELAQRFGQTRR